MTQSFLQNLYHRIDNQDRWREEELSFLPAALEIQETPPSPAGRAIIWSIVLLFSIAILWSILGHIDIVAVAQGRIIPSDRVKVVQPLEIGVIQSIHVEEGQRVVAGQALITMDSTNTDSDRVRLSSELLDAQLRRQRLTAFSELIGNTDGMVPTLTIGSSPYLGDTPADILAVKLAFQKSLLNQQLQEYAAREDALESEHERQLVAKRTAQSEQERSERALPLLTERIAAFEQLLESRYVSRDLYLQLKQSHVELQQDLITLSSRVEELDAAITSIAMQRMTLEAETKRSTLEALEQTAMQSMALEQDLIKAQQRSRQQVLTSSIDGVVQQLNIHTVGGVVTPAQELMLIVPDESQIEVEAFILNRDIGFVEEGQMAEVKIDTFNFTQYGVIDAQIIDISNDAISDEALGLVYMSKVLLTESDIQVGNRLVNFSPGMSVTVEVKTGQRRLIEYFLSPLMRFKQESIRER
ncbi:MAG: HlyD family type I secretion periplasmic adaptor subunit [Gammaproteobacteria bacterium]|nr:HlyD family type I secretion periplasmic adaptor subunit [Gammaproteobacteria bacterium]